MIEDEDMEQPEEIETNQVDREIESGDLETKEPENTNTRPRRANAVKGVEHLKMKYREKTYDTQFTNSTGKSKNCIMHDMHKLAVDVTFTQMTVKKGIKKHVEKAVTSMYK